MRGSAAKKPHSVFLSLCNEQQQEVIYMKKSSEKAAAAGLFVAVVILLQVICTFVRFGPFNITLALAPIVIGGALYGRRFSAMLGGVLGLVILAAGLMGWDGGAVLMLVDASPVALVIVAVGKTLAAGYVAGAVYGFICKKSELAAVLTSAVLCPVVNTGLFIAAMFLFFREPLSAWANGSDALVYVFTGLTGVNFLVEIGVNLVLSAGITRIIKALKK